MIVAMFVFAVAAACAVIAIILYVKERRRNGQ